MSFTFGLALAALLLVCALPKVWAAGPMGADNGWAINNDGSPIYTPQKCAQIAAGGVGWVRIGFRTIPGHTDWINDAMLIADYDTVVNNIRAAGMQIIAGINYESYAGSQADWCANNYEHTGGNGSNAFTAGFTSHAAEPIIKHFHDRIKNWEIWNEPNAWTSSAPGGYYSGGTYLYPSNYSQLLAGTFDTVKEYDNIKDVNLIFGGVFGHSINNVYSYGNAGAQYIDDTYNVGINGVGSFAYTKNRWGVYPVDAIAVHVYIDQGGNTSTAEFQQYLDWDHSAYTKWELPAGQNKKIWITEFGWATNQVSQSTQSNNLIDAFAAIVSRSYVSNAIWFQWQDNPGGGLYYGVLDSNSNQKIAYPYFVNRETYQGKHSDGTSDSNILSYYNAIGQAQLGNPVDHGGGPWVHHWTGGAHYADVQDCDGGSHQGLTIFTDPVAPSGLEVNDVHGLWTYYMAHGGIGHYGVPKNNEYASGSGTRQDFESHYLTWDSTNGVVEH